MDDSETSISFEVPNFTPGQALTVMRALTRLLRMPQVVKKAAANPKYSRIAADTADVALHRYETALLASVLGLKPGQKNQPEVCEVDRSDDQQMPVEERVYTEVELREAIVGWSSSEEHNQDIKSHNRVPHFAAPELEIVYASLASMFHNGDVYEQHMAVNAAMSSGL